ncbi:MAG: class I SAM-dependent methyltransferase [Candidatus Doudnabacteria bacterium]|nr:class I SAM-dependent methyltransferase [Candidatus Doudnabacteria bacterium]
MPKDWWKTFFGKDYLTLWEKKGAFKNTSREIDFVIKLAGIKKPHKILDLCCGHGRHSIELASRGFKVTGLDYSNYELGLARKQAMQRGLNINFIQADARNFKLNNKFDVILNLFSSAIGYGTDQDSQKIINHMAGALKKNGCFVFDIMSATYLLTNYKPKEIIKTGRVKALSTRYFDPKTFTNQEKLVVKEENRTRIYRNSLRVFTYPEMKQMLEKSGLKPIKIYGSLMGKPFSVNTKRMVILARKG